MKKKFVLTLALVLMVAATLVAAPIDLKGSIKAGYTMTFNPNGVTALDTTELDISGLSVSGDFWKVGIGSGPVNFGKDDMNAGTLTVYLSKALAAQGMDMGDLSLEFAIGNTANVKPADVYTDSNDAVAELEMIGAYSTKVTVGYTDLLKVEFAVDPTNTTDKPILLGATVNPIDGVKAALGYTNKTANGTKGGLTASACVDLAALADLDFGLKASAITVYDLNTEKNKLYAELTGSVEDISAWVEYQLIEGTSNVIARVGYSGIENVGTYAKLTLNDFSDLTTKIGAGVNYALGGVTYALDAEYVLDGAFTLKPSVKVSF